MFAANKIVLSLLLLLSVQGQWAYADAAAKKPPPVVEVQSVARAEVNSSLSAIATLKANESIVLKPEVAGRVISIQFAEGQQVKKGQLLVQLDDDLLQAEQAAAQAALNLAQAEFQRYQSLFQEQQVSVLDFERKKAELAQAKAAMSLVQAKLRQKQIRAPFAGVVGLRSFSPGDVVQANQSLVRLTSMSPLKADIKIPETSSHLISLNQTVTLKVDAVPGVQLQGKVTAVDPGLDTTTRAIVLRVLIPQGDNRIREGMTARATFSGGQAQQIVIPEQALVAQGGKFVVFTVKDNTATAVPVKVGNRSVGKVAIVDGLRDGDVIVISGQNKLPKPQMPIKPLMVQGGV